MKPIKFTPLPKLGRTPPLPKPGPVPQLPELSLKDDGRKPEPCPNGLPILARGMAGSPATVAQQPSTVGSSPGLWGKAHRGAVGWARSALNRASPLAATVFPCQLLNGGPVPSLPLAKPGRQLDRRYER